MQGRARSSGERLGGIATSRIHLQVDTVESGDVNLGPDFKVTIYEKLLKELAKTKRTNVCSGIAAAIELWSIARALPGVY